LDLLAGEFGLPHSGSMLEQRVRQKGKVKFFDTDKGYGFIAPDDGTKDVFVHVSAVQGAGLPYLKENMVVSFETRDDAKGRGKQAVVLQLLALS
jgi:cold shock protein